ncbi:eukaryotic translation initiation factor 5B [Pichia californica]|uniref:Eukaryotic translation initiation factor 5B n=1 Tax=Pichia californica TaxID=460514 RepID=A0A9P7BF16_9ASCO|nr:eukaryotic translation initiation factor 5B [[Candida] californica]KAG0686898.1 eukaryotic translation initiation factor 5B [[Candida] californica]
MAKKGKKNNKNDYWDEEFEEDIAPAQEATETLNENQESTEEVTGPTVASAEDEFGGDFLSNLKRAKNKKDKKAKAAEEEKAKQAAAQQQNGPVIKTKKEKEKEKKEREKQRKKQLAERKGASSQAQSATPESTPIPEDNDKSSKADEEAPKEAPKAAKKNAKKVPAGLAALKRQLELKKQAEEEEKRLEEEEKRLEEEEEQRKLEEEKAKEEAKKLKKEKEKAKIELLKKEGKYLTKKQKQEKALQEKRKAALLQSGVIVSGLSGDSTPKAKGGAAKYKKKGKSAHSQETKQSKEQNTTSKSTEEIEGDEEEALVDDWEQMALDDDDVEDEEEREEREEEEFVEKDYDNSDENDVNSQPSEIPVVKIEEKKAPAPVVYAPKSSTLPATTSINKEGKELRSPICCILGHVDTGKTKLLDKIRQTNVQGGEAGGITQQIGATYFPIESIEQKTKVMEQYEKLSYEVPGLLMIDTPGHESFTNLRTRGSSLCNIAILVIDIMHGLEQQTLESIRLLRDRKAPFVVALNKIDRLYDWETIPNNSFRDSLAKQKSSVQAEFENRFTQIKVALAEQGLNSELYFKNPNMSKYVSIVPTSAVTGEGVPDLLWLLLELTQKRMSKQLKYLTDVEATILEVKVVEGLGTTIDVILSNGILHEGDRIILCGMNGPIATNIRALLTPPPARELRIKSEYVHHKEVKAALGVKIAANDLEKAVAGSRLLVVKEDDDEDEMMDDVMEDLTGLLDSVDATGKGVVVQASTLGSLEALLDFLKDMKIPVMSIGLGPVYKRDVMKATTMLDKAKEYAVMLCFDVKVDKEAEQYATEQGIKIFNAEVIYHLFDEFTAYQEKLLEEKRKANEGSAIFPCVLKTLQIINKRNPMIIGVDVTDGMVKHGTPICCVKPDPVTGKKTAMLLGTVASLEVNHESKSSVRKGQTNAGVAMRLDPPSGQQPTWGRHVDEKDGLYSLISRKSIDVLKDPAFRSTVPREDWLLIKKLKTLLDID